MAKRREPPRPIPAPVSNALKDRSCSHRAEVCRWPSQGVRTAIGAQRRAGHFKSLASGTASSARAEWPQRPRRAQIRRGHHAWEPIRQRSSYSGDALVTQRRQASGHGGHGLLPRVRLSARSDRSRRARGRSAASFPRSQTEMVPRGTYSAYTAVVSGQRA
jgi:hypothetical protein